MVSAWQIAVMTLSTASSRLQALAFGVQQLSTTSTNVNFEAWIQDAPHEVVKTKLKVEGAIPEYVRGTLFRNGGAVWKSEDESELFSHIFDGLAKVSSYSIDGDGVTFSTRFIRSSWYDAIMGSKKLPPSIGTGPVVGTSDLQPKTGWIRAIQAGVNTMKFDNAPVNVWDYSDGKLTALTDAPPRAQLNIANLETLQTTTMVPTTRGSKGYELFCTAHPVYSQTVKGLTYNIGVEMGLDGACVILTKESVDTGRAVIGRCSVEGLPYSHSFGITATHAVVILQPLRVSNFDKMLELGFLRAMDEIDYTQVLLFDLETGRCDLNKRIDEKVFFYHSISTAASPDNTISIRLCAYKTPDMLTGDDQFMRLEKCLQGKDFRNKIAKGGTFCDIICNLAEQSVAVEWNDKIRQGFELPTTRYSREAGAIVKSHAQYVYAYGAYANGSQEFDSWGLFKFDTVNNCVAASFQQDSMYVSEPIFVPNPNGNGSEDDGVVLSQVFDGVRGLTALLVLDAVDFSVKATAWTDQRSPMDFHGTWIAKN